MPNKIYATFAFVGPDVDPDAITEATGIQPSRTWKRGERRPAPRPSVYMHSGWEVQSSLDDQLDLGLHVRAVIDQLAPAWDIVCALGRQHDPSVSCAAFLHVDETTPAIDLDCDLLRRIVELNARLDIDVYCWPANDAVKACGARPDDTETPS